MKRSWIYSLILLLLPGIASAQYGLVNQQLQLSGAGYISVPNNGALNSFDRMTIDAWVYPTASGTNMAVVGNNASQGYWFGLSTQLKLRFKPNPYDTYESNGSISLNNWTHIAVSVDLGSMTLRFFVNGGLDRLISLQKSWIAGNQTDFRIGADRAGSVPADHWIGRLDEVRLWDTAIDYATAAGDLYRIPHAVSGGLYGRYLVAAWRLNGNANDPIGSYNGALVGTGSWVSVPYPPHYARIGIWFRNAAQPGNSYDYFLIQNYKGMSLFANYTVECWVKPSASGGNGSFQTIICNSDGTARNGYPFWLGLNKSNDRLRFVPNGETTNFTESTATVPEGQWTHVAARFAGSGSSYTATLFVNGLPAGQHNYSTAGPGTEVLYILGAASTSAGASTTYAYNGIIDELRLWNDARSNLEIADNHRREFGGPESGLVGSYRFDGDVRDASGYNHHGEDHYGYSDFFFYNTMDLPSEPSLRLIAPAGGEDWFIGATGTIRWTSNGLHYVTVDLSRDGGTTWSEVIFNAGPAGTGMLSWPVTAPETDKARVRVRTPTPTPLEDESGDLRIVEPPPVLLVDPAVIDMTISRGSVLPPPRPVSIRNTGGSLLNWTASHGGATWLVLTPTQATGNDDTLLVGLTTTDIPEGWYSETITIGGNAVNQGLQIPVNLHVTAKRIYAVSGFVRDTLGAGIGDILMKAEGELPRESRSAADGSYELPDLPSGDYVVAPRSFYYVSTPPQRSYTPLANFEPGAHFVLRPSWGTMVFRYQEGWNLISLPLIPDQADVASYLPDAIMPAFAWDADSGYVRRWQLEPFAAYWIKFTKTDSVELRGKFQRDLLLSFAPTLTGWQMVGMPSGPCRVDAVVQNPAGMLLSTYEYDAVYGYLPPVDGVLVPGKGLFMKIGVGGELLIRGAEEEHGSAARQLLRYPAALRR
jgi:hypothetical protein